MLFCCWGCGLVVLLVCFGVWGWVVGLGWLVWFGFVSLDFWWDLGVLVAKWGWCNMGLSGWFGFWFDLLGVSGVFGWVGWFWVGVCCILRFGG